MDVTKTLCFALLTTLSAGCSSSSGGSGGQGGQAGAAGGGFGGFGAFGGSSAAGGTGALAGAGGSAAEGGSGAVGGSGTGATGGLAGSGATGGLSGAGGSGGVSGSGGSGGSGGAVGSCQGYCGGQTPSGCWCNTACTNFGDCCSDYASVCGGGGSGGTGGGGGLDLVNCAGPASTTGSVYGTTPQAKIGQALPDPSGAVKIALFPKLTPTSGDIAVVVYAFLKPGQYSYPPNGSVGCALLERTASGWSTVDTSQLCEVNLSKLQPASTSGTCDGLLSGTFQGIFAGNQPLAGTFTLPLDLSASDLPGPSCQPYNGPCSLDSECCSKSCSKFIGVCN